MRRRPLLGALWAGAVSSSAFVAARGGAATRSSPAPGGSAAPGPGPAPAPAPAPARAREAGGESPPAVSTGSSGDPPALGVSHRALRFPADHGAHPDTHVEWWYVTGWLRSATASSGAGPAVAAGDVGPPPEFGFQVTFFRTRTGFGETSASRFAARQLVFGHVALTDLAAGRAADGGLMHDQRAAREGFGFVRTPAQSGVQVAQLRDWSLSRAAAMGAAAGALRVDVRSERFALALALQATQPVMLQGDAGYSRKGPSPGQASHYYSEPQLSVRGRLERAGQAAREVVGRAWLDHEWSDTYLPADAVGWDWVGFNLADGGALMAFRMRHPDGSVLWAGGSFRGADGVTRAFSPTELAFTPLRRWTSPRTRTAYPVEWRLDTPVGSFRIAALQDDQELDSRDSTGTLYWEGLCALARADGRPAGWGYLELTGYADRLRL